MKTPEEIKRCPFCGGLPSISRGTNVDITTQDNRPAVGCGNCNIEIHGRFLADAVKKWNERRDGGNND